MQPGDTKGDTKLSTVFVSNHPMSCARPTAQNNLRLQRGEEAFENLLHIERHDLVGEFFESWVAAQRVEEWMDPDKGYIDTFFLPITLLEPIDRLFLIAETDIDQGTTISPDRRFAKLPGVIEHLQGSFTFAF